MEKTEIKKHLKRGDMRKIALKASVSRVTVHNVLNGEHDREDILRIAEAIAESNKAATERVLQELNAD